MSDREPGFSRAEEAPAGRRVEAKVKWFNATKGFGFVTLPDGSQDAFLPMAILRRAGYDDVREGASITCEVGAGAKGPLVLNVLNIDNSTAAEGGERRATRPASTLDGAVKWFAADKGYGFIAPDGGGKEGSLHFLLRKTHQFRGVDEKGLALPIRHGSDDAFDPRCAGRFEQNLQDPDFTGFEIGECAHDPDQRIGVESRLTRHGAKEISPALVIAAARGRVLGDLHPANRIRVSRIHFRDPCVCSPCP